MYGFYSYCKNPQSMAVWHVALQKHLSTDMKHIESGLELKCVGVSNRTGKEGKNSSQIAHNWICISVHYKSLSGTIKLQNT